MIPVGMGEQKKIFVNIPFNKGISQSADPGPGINNDGFSCFRCNLNTGRIPSILEVLPARYRYRSS